MTLPAWKAALLDKKYRRDEEGRKRQEEEDWQLEAMPAWKRDLVLKKRAGVQLNSWRVTPRPATVSTNFSQGSRTAVTVKPVTATSKNNSQDKVASEAPTHNHVHSADETDSPARTAPIDAQDHQGVSEEHVTSVHDNPFFKLERKRLNSGSGERPVLNRKPPSRNEVDELNRNTTSTTTTTTTTGSSNTNTTLRANQTKTVSYSSGNMTSTPVDSSKNKPYEPEVIIIPKPKNRIIVDNRMIEQRPQEPVPKQIRLRTRSLSPAARVVRRQLSGESESSSPRSPSSESPMHSPRSVDNENEESVEKGTVNKLLGLFGKAATPDDLRRGRFNSLERNTYTKPKLEGVVKSTHSLENSSKPPLPPSAVVKKAPITPMTTVTTQRKYSAPSKPVVVNATPEPKPEAKPAETTSVPSKESEEVVNEEPVVRPRRSRKKKLDASTIISLENSGHPTAKQENYAKPSVSAPTEDKPMKIDERSNEDDTDIGRHKKVHPLEIKTEEDRNEVIKPNTVSNIRNSFSEYNGPVPVPVAVPSSKKRRAPPPPQQPPYQKQEQTSRNNSAKVKVGNTEQATLKPVNKDEGKPTKTSEGNKPASEPVAKPVQPTPASTTQIKQTSIKKVDQQSVVSKQPTQQNNISKQPTQQTVMSKQPMQQPSISKQTIIMTPVKPDSQTTKSDSEVRQAVEELKSVGTTFRITPRTNNTTASNSNSKKETKIVLAPSKTSNENEKSAKSTKKTVVLKTYSNTGTVQAEKETAVSPVNHIPENKDDVPVTNIDDIPVSNIDDFLSPPTSPTPTDSKQVTVSEESVSVVKNANSETPKTVQNGTVIVNGTNEAESKKKAVEPVNDIVKPPLKRISGGKFKKITNYQFIGENAPTGKPSMLTKSRTKKRNITFNDSATVKHMYPSEESLLEDDEDAIQPLQESDSDNNEDSSGKTTEVSKAGLKSNTALTAQGGLQSYTPSHLQDAYMNSLEKRKQEKTKTEEKKEKEPEPAQPDVIAVKPLDDKDADYFSTSSSSTALMF